MKWVFKETNHEDRKQIKLGSSGEWFLWWWWGYFGSI